MVFEEQFATIPEAAPDAIKTKDMFELLIKIIEFILVFPTIPAALWVMVDVIWEEEFVIFKFTTFYTNP